MDSSCVNVPQYLLDFAADWDNSVAVYGLGNHSYARNPNAGWSGIAGVWCLTTDPDVEWEYVHTLEGMHTPRDPKRHR